MPQTTYLKNLKPTEKQERAVLFITNTLHIPPPRCETFKAYHEFISEHIDDARLTDARETQRRAQTLALEMSTNNPAPVISETEQELLDTFRSLSPRRQRLAMDVIHALAEPGTEAETTDNEVAGAYDPNDDLMF